MSRPAPFSLRLNEDERQRLEAHAGAMPLASYIKSVVFDAAAPKYRKRRKPPVAEKQLLAEVLVRLGQTRQANNLNQIAKAINQGTLFVVDELAETVGSVHDSLAPRVRWERILPTSFQVVLLGDGM